MWNENFGTLTPYRKISRNIEQSRHPLYTSSEIEKEVRSTRMALNSRVLQVRFIIFDSCEQASRRFEKSAWLFFHRTLRAARRLRPKALWGYYGFPLCFNFTPKNRQASCSSSVKENNERFHLYVTI